MRIGFISSVGAQKNVVKCGGLQRSPTNRHRQIKDRQTSRHTYNSSTCIHAVFANSYLRATDASYVVICLYVYVRLSLVTTPYPGGNRYQWINTLTLNSVVCAIWVSYTVWLVNYVSFFHLRCKLKHGHIFIAPAKRENNS